MPIAVDKYIGFYMNLVPDNDTVQIVDNIDISNHSFALECRYIREEFIAFLRNNN